MFDIVTILLAVVTGLMAVGLLSFRSITKKAASLNKLQVFSKEVNASIQNTGVYTEHGMVYDPLTKTLTAQHKRSKLFYETVL